MEHIGHEVGGGLPHNDLSLRRIVQNHVALGVLHPQIRPGLVEHAAVGNGPVGPGHFNGAQAPGQAAHGQR